MKTKILIFISFYISLTSLAQIPDYNLPQNWLAHPMKTTDASKLSLKLEIINPDLSIKNTIQYQHPTTNTGVDIFYIYPTLDGSLTTGNVAINKIDTNYAKFVFRMQAGIYAQFGRVFAPYHKQITYGTYVFASKQSQANYLNTAYQDVEAAFLHYMNNYNNGNKIILIGHSQGGGHVGFLLKKLFDNNPSLQSKLVVALIGGMSNFVAKGDVKGGLLQNIAVCPPRSSGYNCGCTMSWRTYKEGSTIPSQFGNNQPLNNKYLTADGLQYSTFDTLLHEVSYYDFGYSKSKNLTNYITLNTKDSSTYIGYDADMYSVQNAKQSASAAGLMVKNIQQIGDKRVSPFPLSETDFHRFDLQIVQGDLITILNEMITYCTKSVGVDEKSGSLDKIGLYPNPSNGIFRFKNDNFKHLDFEIYNMFGVKVFKSSASTLDVEIDLSEQPKGIYFIYFINDNKLISTSKLVITE